MGTDSVIYIRTDGNSHIATGHLVRCLCIAQALESLGKSVCFLVSDKESFSLLQNLAATIFENYTFSFTVKILETAKYDDLELELGELEIFFHSSPLPVILIDSYYVTQHYFTSLEKFAKVAYMDDLRTFDYKVDLVINYDVIPPAKKEEYTLSYTNASITMLGTEYTPLRRQFQNQEITLRDQIKNILITTGGSDPYNFTSALANYLLSMKSDSKTNTLEKKLLESLEIHIVVGKLFKNTETLEKLAEHNSALHLHYNVRDMASLMKQCDYAVSAAGTTLYELCALGIPTISISMTDNQIPMAETFADVGAIPYAGDIRLITTDESENIFIKILNHLTFLQNNMANYTIQQKNMNCLVAGNGAVKIAQEICNL